MASAAGVARVAAGASGAGRPGGRRARGRLGRHRRGPPPGPGRRGHGEEEAGEEGQRPGPAGRRPAESRSCPWVPPFLSVTAAAGGRHIAGSDAREEALFLGERPAGGPRPGPLGDRRPTRVGQTGRRAARSGTTSRGCSRGGGREVRMPGTAVETGSSVRRLLARAREVGPPGRGRGPRAPHRARADAAPAGRAGRGHLAAGAQVRERGGPALRRAAARDRAGARGRAGRLLRGPGRRPSRPGRRRPRRVLELAHSFAALSRRQQEALVELARALAGTDTA